MHHLFPPKPRIWLPLRAVGILAGIALAGVVLLLSTQTAEAATVRRVALAAGDNLVVYTGAAIDEAELVRQLPGLERGWRWKPEEQRYDVFVLGQTLPGDSREIESGEALWLRMSRAEIWELEQEALPAFVTLVGGWNLVAWGGADGMRPEDAFAGVIDRVGSVFTFDAMSERFLGYSPDLSPALNTLIAIDRFAALWVRVTPGPPLAWGQALSTSGAGPEAGAWAGMDASAVERAMVLVGSDEASGSGFVVGPQAILTAAHVAGETEWLTVWLSNGRQTWAQVVAIDRTLDLALAVVPDMPDEMVALDWRSAEPPSMAQAVWVWGYPVERLVLEAGLSRSPTVSLGIVSSLRLRDGVALLQIDAAVNRGNSGGPVLTEDGRVIGLVTSILQSGGVDLEGLNFALDLTAQRDVIEGWLREIEGS